MDKTGEKPKNPKSTSQLYIISPEELLKLGIFNNNAEKKKPPSPITPPDLDLKKAIRDKLMEGTVKQNSSTSSSSSLTKTDTREAQINYSIDSYSDKTNTESLKQRLVEILKKADTSEIKNQNVKTTETKTKDERNLQTEVPEKVSSLQQKPMKHLNIISNESVNFSQKQLQLILSPPSCDNSLSKDFTFKATEEQPRNVNETTTSNEVVDNINEDKTTEIPKLTDIKSSKDKAPKISKFKNDDIPSKDSKIIQTNSGKFIVDFEKPLFRKVDQKWDDIRTYGSKSEPYKDGILNEVDDKMFARPSDTKVYRTHANTTSPTTSSLISPKIMHSSPTSSKMKQIEKKILPYSSSKLSKNNEQPQAQQPLIKSTGAEAPRKKSDPISKAKSPMNTSVTSENVSTSVSRKPRIQNNSTKSPKPILKSTVAETLKNLDKIKSIAEAKSPMDTSNTSENINSSISDADIQNNLNMSDTTTPTSDVKIPKKRGRKKKSEAEATITSELNSSALSTDEMNSSQNSTSNVDIDVPKKRGRKKKSAEETITSDISSSSLFTDEVNSPTQNTPSSIETPKKRGRKKKSESISTPQEDAVSTETIQSNSNINMEEETTPITMSQSKSGRIRKSINYFALANPEVFDNIADKRRRSDSTSSLSNSEESPMAVPRKKPRVRKLTLIDLKQSQDSPVHDKSQDQMEVQESGSSKDQESTNDLSASSKQTRIDPADSEESEVPQSPLKKRGRPSKADSLKHRSNKLDVTQDSNKTSESKTEQEQTPQAAKKRGRPKKIDSSRRSDNQLDMSENEKTLKTHDDGNQPENFAEEHTADKDNNLDEIEKPVVDNLLNIQNPISENTVATNESVEADDKSTKPVCRDEDVAIPVDDENVSVLEENIDSASKDTEDNSAHLLTTNAEANIESVSEVSNNSALTTLQPSEDLVASNIDLNKSQQDTSSRNDNDNQQQQSQSENLNVTDSIEPTVTKSEGFRVTEDTSKQCNISQHNNLNILADIADNNMQPEPAVLHIIEENRGEKSISTYNEKTEEDVEHKPKPFQNTQQNNLSILADIASKEMMNIEKNSSNTDHFFEYGSARKREKFKKLEASCDSNTSQNEGKTANLCKDGIELAEEISLNQDQSRISKKRCRKTKIDLNQELVFSDDDSDIDQSDKISMPKKRERTEKIEETDVSLKDEIVDPSSGGANKNNESIKDCSEIVVPKKRGRKKQSEQIQDSGTSLNISEVAVQNVLDDKPVKIEETVTGLNDEIVELSSGGANKNNESIQDCSDVVVPKKRGRKKKSEQIQDNSTSLNISNVSIQNVPEDSNVKSEVPVVRKRGRPRKIVPQNDDPGGETGNQETENSILESDVSKETEQIEHDQTVGMNDSNISDVNIPTTSTPVVKKLAKKHGPALVAKSLLSMMNFAPSDSTAVSYTPKIGRPKKGGVQNEEMMKKVDVDIVDSEGNVTCALCNIKIKEELWQQHRKEVHYNLTWRLGEMPVHMNEKSLNILVVGNDYKCFKCESVRKSGKGYIRHVATCEDELDDDENVTCAICNEEMDKGKWYHHKRKVHNSLAWKIGETPLDLSNQAFVLSTLNAAYKAKRPLYCYKCKTSKKSVMGFLSHQTMCMKSEKDLEESVKVKCKLCDRKVLPVSMTMHMKWVHPPEPRKQEGLKEADTEDEFKAGSKRLAAKKALETIDNLNKINSDEPKYYVKQLNFKEEKFVGDILKTELSETGSIKCKYLECEYTGTTVEEVIEHLSSCPRTPEEYYGCSFCLVVKDTESDITKHLREIHNISLQRKQNNDDEYVMEEMDDEPLKHKEKKVRRKPMPANALHRPKPHFIVNCVRYKNKLFKYAKHWTMDFCQQFFYLPKIHENLISSARNLLNENVLEDYLPSLYESCYVASEYIRPTKDRGVTQNHEFKKYEMFEAQKDNAGNITIFCGGPVGALAWLPTPHTSESSVQVLAVSVRKDPDSKYLVDENYNEHSLIQFWHFGVLRKKQSTEIPRLMFSLAFNNGPIWDLEWCPSGCYNEDDKRMGLLAVTGSDSFVYIYSIPFLNEKHFGGMYEMRPVLKLQLHTEDYSVGKQKFFPTKISWSKAAGHNFIAVGYSHGMVGMFNIASTASLIKRTGNDNIMTILPYMAFQPHTHYITALALYHLKGGNRWLFTGSFDRKMSTWDLNNMTDLSFFKKNLITDGVWLSHWIGGAASTDDSVSTIATCNTTFKVIRNFYSDVTSLLYGICPINCISGSDWLNIIMHGTANGNVEGVFAQQLLCGVDHDKILRRNRYIISKTKLIEKTPDSVNLKSIIVENSTVNNQEDEENYKGYHFGFLKYGTMDQNYKIVFSDLDLSSAMESQKEISHLSTQAAEKYPNYYPHYELNGIRKVSLNPNYQASTYFAIGYQAGFVRVVGMKYLNKDNQVL